MNYILNCIAFHNPQRVFLLSYFMWITVLVALLKFLSTCTKQIADQSWILSLEDKVSMLRQFISLYVVSVYSTA